MRRSQAAIQRNDDRKHLHKTAGHYHIHRETMGISYEQEERSTMKPVIKVD